MKHPFKNLWLSLGFALTIAATSASMINSARAGAVCESCEPGGQNYGKPCCHPPR